MENQLGKQELNAMGVNADARSETASSSSLADTKVQATNSEGKQAFDPFDDIICPMCSSLDVFLLGDPEEQTLLPPSKRNFTLPRPITIHSRMAKPEKELGPEYQRRGRFLVWPATLGIPFEQAEVST